MQIVLTQMLELLGIYIGLAVLLALVLLAAAKILKRAGRAVPHRLSGTAGRLAAAAFAAYLALLVYLTLCNNLWPPVPAASIWCRLAALCGLLGIALYYKLWRACTGACGAK